MSISVNTNFSKNVPRTNTSFDWGESFSGLRCYLVESEVFCFKPYCLLEKLAYSLS